MLMLDDAQAIIAQTLKYDTHSRNWQNAFDGFAFGSLSLALFAQLYYYIIHGQIDNESIAHRR